MNNSNPSSDGAQGLEAINRGDLVTAFNHLNSAVRQGDKHPSVLIGLALVARAQSKYEISLHAVDLFLQISPNDVNANIVKGDALTALGKKRAAISFYMAAIRLTQNVTNLPANLVRDIQRCQKACDDAQHALEDTMLSSLADLGLNNGNGQSRIEQTVDILMGRKQIYPQRPSKLYFPELPQIQFYDPAHFEWVEVIKSAKEEIKAELLALMSEDNLFEPYMAHNPSAASGNMGLTQDDKWSSFHLIRDGKEIADNIARCPRTYEIISATAPIARIPGRSPNILFSKLEGGAHIPPHHGQINVRLLCHLPLIVPKGCQLRVGNQTRDVVEGEMMIFDDSIEHEARNSSNQQRIVLIFDIWRPEITEQERSMLCSIFEKIEEID